MALVARTREIADPGPLVGLLPTDHPMIRRACEGHPPWPVIRDCLTRLGVAARNFDYPTVRVILREAVAEYQPENGIEDWVWRAGPGETVSKD